jgi:hypothetical protein
MTDPRDEGARELIIAIFRLAVCDFLGISYSHDQVAPARTTKYPAPHGSALFLSGAWATHLADLVALSGPAIWCEARRLRDAIDVRKADELNAA